MTRGMSTGQARELALKLAAKGLHVFPIRFHSDPDKNKTPATVHGKPKGGFHNATADPAEVEELFNKIRLGPGEHPGVGVAPGPSGYIVLDVDIKDGGTGWQDFAHLDKAHGELPAATRVDTASGGAHFWLKRPSDDEVGNVKFAGAHSIDIRCDKGYVVAPGCWSPWGAWKWDNTTPKVEDTPKLPHKWTAALLSQTRSDTREAIPDRITAGHRHDSLVRVAGALRRQGVGYEVIHAALRVMNETRCDPPKSADLVDKIARDIAERYDPEPDLNVSLVLPGEAEETNTFIDWSKFWSKDRTDPEWLVEDVLARGRGHALYAPAGTKKSLFTLWMAAKTATGRQPVAVVYLDYEMTEDDLYERLKDMGYGPESDLSRLRYALLPTLPPLDTKDGAEAVGQMLDGVQADLPDHHILVVIDTTGRAVEGEENSADTFRRFYSATGIALKRRGVTWCRLDHTGKDISKGQRGSKGKDDDPDVVWELRETENGIMLTAKKRRMGWVPERSAFAQSADPLRFTPIAGDWPKGTEETADVLDRLAVPLDASTRTAQGALKEAGEGRRRELVVAAQKWRNHPGNHSQIRLPEPSAEPPGENPMNTRAEPPPEPAGTNPSGIPGTGSLSYEGTVTEAGPETSG